MKPASRMPARVPASKVSRLCEVMDLMLDSVGDPLALETLAASASYSSFHFDRIFRELTGFSAVEYQRKRRLRRAAHLLRHEPDVAIVRIAQDCGFPSNAAFAKAFKQQFAMSAKAWREGGWREYMDQQVGRESDVSFFVAEPSNLGSHPGAVHRARTGQRGRPHPRAPRAARRTQTHRDPYRSS